MRLWYNLEKKSWHLSVKFCCVVCFFHFSRCCFPFLSFGFLIIFMIIYFLSLCAFAARCYQIKSRKANTWSFSKSKKKRSKTKTNKKKPYNTPLYITTITTRRGAKIARYCKKPQLDRSRKLALHSLARSLRSLDIVSSVKEKLCTFPSRDTLDRRGALCRAPDTIQATASVCLAINSIGDGVSDSISERCKRERDEA